MNDRIYKLNLQSGHGNLTSVGLSQYDAGVPLRFIIYDGAVAAMFPALTTAKIQGVRPSGVGFNIDCTLTDNIVTVDSTTDMTGEAGKFPVEIRFESSGENVGTVNFDFAIEKAPHPDGTIDADITRQQTVVERLDAIEQEIVPDQTLSIRGKAADAKSAGDAIRTLTANMSNKVNAPLGGFGTAGQVLSTLGDGGTEWIDMTATGGGGTPIVALTAADMTDHDAIYVYMGNESGYVNGHWYYYDGSAWVDSGKYAVGLAGEDGYSPSATVTQTETGAQITVTDKDGTTTADIENGTATDEQVAAWLDEHPEATTTVQDGAITRDKLAGIVDPESIIEHTGYYLADSTGVLTANANFCVTKMIPVEEGQKIILGGRYYGNSYDKKNTYALYDSNMDLISCTYQASYLTNGDEGKFFYTWGEIPAGSGAAYLRFTTRKTWVDAGRVFFTQFWPEETQYTNTALNKAIGAMASGNLTDGSVSFKNLDFVEYDYYNKFGYHRGKVYDIPIYYNDPEGADPNKPLNGMYLSDLVSGEMYYSDKDLRGRDVAASPGSSLVCFDADGNLIGTTYRGLDNDIIFDVYNDVVVDYVHHYEFSLKPNIATVYIRQFDDTLGYGEHLICKLSEYNALKDIHDVTVTTTSEDFAALVRNITDTFDGSALEGKIWVALGDSYTAQMSTVLESIASEYGLIVDNRGVTSSTVCGDPMAIGNKGYRVFWERADGIVSDYTSGHEINGQTYTRDDVALVTVMGGANDGFGIATWIGEAGLADTDTGHIYGAMAHILNAFTTNFQKAQFLVVTQPPNYNRTVDMSLTDEDVAAWGFASAADYRRMSDVQLSNYSMAIKERAIKEVAWEFAVPILDAFTEFPTIFKAENRSRYWNGDKIHLSGEGYNLLGKMIMKKIREIFS